MTVAFIASQILFEHILSSRSLNESHPTARDQSPPNASTLTPSKQSTTMPPSLSNRQSHISYDNNALANDNKSSAKRARAVSSVSTGESRFHLSPSRLYSRRSLSVIANKGGFSPNNYSGANNGKSPQGSIISIYSGHGAASSSSTTLVEFYSAAKLAPPVAGANVEEYVRGREDGKVMYIIQVHPHNVNLPFLDKMPIPRKAYSIYRRYEDIVGFAEQLEEEFPWLRTSQVSVRLCSPSASLPSDVLVGYCSLMPVTTALKVS